MNGNVKIIEIFFKHSKKKLIMNLDAILETEIVFAMPYDRAVLVVTYRGFKQEYFCFIQTDTAQQLKNAIDEKRDYVILEDI